MLGDGSAAIYHAYRPNLVMSAINRRTTDRYLHDKILVVLVLAWT